jgi:DNA-directed RNA polymerase subunit M/transcription elongation factor TFIIS
MKYRRAAVARANMPTSGGPSQMGTDQNTGQVIVSSPEIPLNERMKLLGLPTNIIEALLTIAFTVENTSIPLFAIGRSAASPDSWIYNMTELKEAIRVYDLYLGRYTETGKPNDPVRAPYSTLPADESKFKSYEEANQLFINYLWELARNKEAKAKKNLLIPDDSVYEAPALVNYRKEEIIKVNLLNRKRVPVKGRSCPRSGCTSDEVYEIQLQTRSGDEGANWHNKCAKCYHTWVI